MLGVRTQLITQGHHVVQSPSQGIIDVDTAPHMTLENLPSTEVSMGVHHVTTIINWPMGPIALPDGGIANVARPKTHGTRGWELPHPRLQARL